MSKRTIAAYESAFRYIHENLIPLRGEAIIIDFEKAIRKALVQVLRSIDSVLVILGCWFHFCQALRRKVAQMSELFEKINTDEKYRDIFRRFQCLPLLPLHHIESSFRDLAKEALNLDKQLFAPFVNYFNREWMNIVTPKHFCVYMRDKRTTGDAESFNSKLNQLFKAHPGLFLFCETLQQLEAVCSTQLINYVNGTEQKDGTNKYYKKRSKLIREVSVKHKDDPVVLLKVLANQKYKILYSSNEITANEEDVKMAATAELYADQNDKVNTRFPKTDESKHDDLGTKFDDAEKYILHYSGITDNFPNPY